MCTLKIDIFSAKVFINEMYGYTHELEVNLIVTERGANIKSISVSWISAILNDCNSVTARL